jgi:hypothetical protein
MNISLYPIEHVSMMSEEVVKVASVKQVKAVAGRSKYGEARGLLVKEGVFAFPGELGSHSVAAYVLGYDGKEDPLVEKLVFNDDGEEVFQGYGTALFKQEKQ